MIGYLVVYGGLGLLALFVIALSAAGARRVLEMRRLDAAWKEYEGLQREHGDRAKEFCPHRVIEFGQTGVAGVVTVTTKWCKTCRKHLGSAKLVESAFGNRWE